MWKIVFEKAKVRDRTLNRASVYAQNTCTGIPFWCFIVNYAKFIRRSFLKNSTERLLLIIALSIVAKGAQANETVNYEARNKTYVLI